MTHDTEALTERMARGIAVHARVPEAIGWRIYAGHIRAALASIPGSGWRLVPEVATEGMVLAVADTELELGDDAVLGLGFTYQIMLNAAPAIGEVG